MNKVKVTVLRRECFCDLQKKYLKDPESGKCPMFKEGQEFIFDPMTYQSMNNGKFCGETWDCIHKYVYTALNGGSPMEGWTNDNHLMIACCNDGTRPVIFKIERLDNEGVDESK